MIIFMFMMEHPTQTLYNWVALVGKIRHQSGHYWRNLEACGLFCSGNVIKISFCRVPVGKII